MNQRLGVGEWGVWGYNYGQRVRAEGNEPWAEVKSKVEAHLLQSDDSRANEAGKRIFKKPHYSFCANWWLAH